MAEPLAVYGAVTGTAGALAALWRIFEWWMGGRPHVKVLASAGEVQAGTGQWIVLRGENFRDSAIMIEVINNGRRPITIESVGLVNGDTNERHGIVPPAGQLPAKLEPWQKVTIFGETQEWRDKLTAPSTLVPFCTDAEGHTYKGKPDEHFRRLVRKLRDKESAA